MAGIHPYIGHLVVSMFSCSYGGEAEVLESEISELDDPGVYII